MSQQNADVKQVSTDEKTLKIEGGIDFCGLPIKDESTTIEKSDSVKISVKKLIAQYETVNIDNIYGKRSKKIPRDEDAISEVETFLKAFFETCRKEKIVSDDNEEISESFEIWRDRQVLIRCRLMILQRARAEAIRLDTIKLESAIGDLEKAATAGKTDVDSIAKLQALLEKMKSGLSAEDLAMLEQAS